MSLERVSVGEEGEGHSMKMDRRQKGAGTNSEESGARNLEAESTSSGAESTGGCVKLKTVTEIRQSSARDTFIAESVYLVIEFFITVRVADILVLRCLRKLSKFHSCQAVMLLPNPQYTGLSSKCIFLSDLQPEITYAIIMAILNFSVSGASRLYDAFQSNLV